MNTKDQAIDTMPEFPFIDSNTNSSPYLLNPYEKPSARYFDESTLPNLKPIYI